MARHGVKIVAIISLLICINLSTVKARIATADLVIRILDVGQGDAILISTPDGKRGLIDSGKGDAVLSELAEVLDGQYLDFILATHPDADHIEGFLSVLQHYRVKQVLWADNGKDSEVWFSLLEQVKSLGIASYVLTDVNDFRFGCCLQLDVVWPNQLSDKSQIEDMNDMSLALLLSYGKFTMFTAGDLGHEYEELAVENLSQVDVLKLGHHGSKTSTSSKVLQLLQPRIGIVSAGSNNSYGHPHPEVLENLAKVYVDLYRTDTDGRIKISTDGQEAFICKQNQLECKAYSL